MKLEQLRYIIETARVGSINKAAQNMFVSQPNLSSSIKQLENELNINIFKRTNQGIEPTEIGLEFIRHAKMILDQMDFLQGLYANYDETQISLSVSSLYSLFVVDLLADLCEEYKGTKIRINLKESNSLNTIKYVSDGEADIGIISFSSLEENIWLNLLRLKGLQHQTLLEEQIHAIVGRNSPLFFRESVSVEECINYPMISVEHMHKAHQVELKYAGFDGINSIINVSDTRSMMQFISRIPAFSLGSKSLNANNIYVTSGQIKYIPFQNNEVLVKTCWVKTKERTLSEVGQKFIQRLEKHFQCN